jgi:hypothetical protein
MTITGKDYQSTPDEVLLRIKEDSESISTVYLINTLSHVLIKKSSLYTELIQIHAEKWIFVSSGLF